MKFVDVYEVSQTQRVLEATYDKIPTQELMRDGGRAWGNPDGGDRFIRYDLPVTHVADERVEDGFVHRRDYYVAIGPRLLELLGPAVNEGMSATLKRQTLSVERLLQEKRQLSEAVETWQSLDMSMREGNRMLRDELEMLIAERRNFLEANVPATHLAGHRGPPVTGDQMQKSFLRSAAMAIMLAGAAFSPALSSRRSLITPNLPGERLRNDPPKRPKKRTGQDIARLYDAQAKRDHRELERLWAKNSGGWASTQAWLARMELRKAVARADAEFDARYAGASQ